MKKLSNQTLSEIATKATTEVLSIIVAVLFALWADQWWEDRKLNQEAAEMASKIEAELAENVARVRKSHQHHSAQIEFIKNATKDKTELSEDDYADINRTLYRKGIYRPAQIYFTNWEIAVEKGTIARIAEDKLQIFKPSYSDMESYISEWKSIADSQILVALLAKTDKDKLQLTYASLSEIWWKEKNIIEQFEKSFQPVKLLEAETQ